MAGRLRPHTAGGARGRPARDDDDAASTASFGSIPSPTKQAARFQTWTGNAQIDHECYHKMLEEYRAAKAKQAGDELKIKQLAAQLARTEEAAKRALVRSDAGAKGSTAQQLLDAQRTIQQLQAENSELSSKLAREKKRCVELRAASEDHRRRLEAALREQRALVRRLGEAERSLGGSAAARSAARRAAAEQEFWSEEAGRRFAAQQEELVGLREANTALQAQLEAAVPADTAVRYEAAVKELQQLVAFYERRLAAQPGSAGLAAGGAEQAGPAAGDGGGACGRWLLEALTEAGACFLWEPASGRVFSDPPQGCWPRPIGMKQLGAAGGLQLGSRARLDAALRALADALQRSSGSPGLGSGRAPPRAGDSRGACAALGEALRQLLSRGDGARAPGSVTSAAGGSGGVVDVRDLAGLLGCLLPGLAIKEAAELAAWLRAGCSGAAGQSHGQSLDLADAEAAAKDLLDARDAVRQGHDAAVNEVLLRVRRLLRQEVRAVAAAFDAAEGPDGCVGSLQVLELLRQEQLLPDLSPAEARHLLVLLHEWDLPCTGRHSLSDMYAALQLLALVRVPPGTLSGPQGAAWLSGMPASGLALERPDSRQSSTSTSLTASTSATKAYAGASDTALAASGRQQQQHQQPQQQPRKGARRGGSGGGGGGAVAWEGAVQQLAAAGVSSAAAGASLKEAFLRERVAALEAQLAGARSSSAAGTANNQQVEALRAEVARYQARLSELENDFLNLDVVANTEVGEYDAEMRKAWFTAAAFKKRYVEHKLELDAIKATADKMQAALDDTHRALHAEAARRMALEEAAAVARLEAGRAKELAATVAAERAERVKLEKDYLELQSKAFAAPGSALAEVRQLREELLAARRDRAVGEAREAELRREIASLKRQLEGVSPEEHRRLVRELAEAQRCCTSTELELRAALDKLEVYRWADSNAATAAAAAAAATAGGAAAAPGTAAGAGAAAGQQPDEGKSVPELCAELAQLRQAIALEGSEAAKLRKLLETESAICLEAKAALEDAHAALASAKADAAQQLAKLRREQDARDERIRRLEGQLAGAYGGLSRAGLRASAAAAAGAPEAAGSVRVSRVGGAPRAGGAGAGAGGVQQSLEGLLAALGPHENALELVVAEATLAECAFAGCGGGGGADGCVQTLVAWDFYLHDSQATPPLPGLNPRFDTTVQYIVEADAFLLEYLQSQQLRLELLSARGWDVAPLGVGHLPLRLLLQDVEVGSALGASRAWHHVDVLGAAGQRVARLRLGFRFAKPLHKLLLESKAAAAAKEQQQRDAGAAAAAAAAAGAAGGSEDAPQQQQQQQQPGGLASETVLRRAAEQADADPAKASHLLITIHRCEGLVQQQTQQQAQQQAQQQQQQQQHAASAPVPARRPYAHYTAPGRSTGHDTGVGAGPAPRFDDAASWALVRSTSVDAALGSHVLQVAVFDDAVVADPAAALLGVAAVPLAPLAAGVPVEGAFPLVSPAGQPLPGGCVVLSAAWHDPLQQPAPRVPLLGLLPADGAAAAAAGAQPLQQQPPLLLLQPQPPLPQQQQQQQQPAQLQLQPQPAWAQVMQLPAPLAAVPMLQQQGTLPGVSTAAAAAVQAALGMQQQQLMLPQGPPPGDPTAPFAAAPGSGSILLLPQGQLAAAAAGAASRAAAPGLQANRRYDGSWQLLEQSLEGLPLGAGDAAAGRSASPAAAPPAASSSGLPPPPAMLPTALPGAPPGPGLDEPAELPVLRLVSPLAEAWRDFDTTIYFKVDCVELSADALQDVRHQRHVLCAHMLLEDFTRPSEQCTEPVLARGPGPLTFSSAAAYSVAHPGSKLPTPAGAALAAALADAEAGRAPRLVLPVLLASSAAPVVTDFSLVECVASCELDLSDLWEGGGDVICRELQLVPGSERAGRYPSGSAGSLRLTLVAARALDNLRLQCCGREAGA